MHSDFITVPAEFRISTSDLAAALMERGFTVIPPTGAAPQPAPLSEEEEDAQKVEVTTAHYKDTQSVGARRMLKRLAESGRAGVPTALLEQEFGKDFGSIRSSVGHAARRLRQRNIPADQELIKRSNSGAYYIADPLIRDTIVRLAQEEGL